MNPIKLLKSLYPNVHVLLHIAPLPPLWHCPEWGNVLTRASTWEVCCDLSHDLWVSEQMLQYIPAAE